MQNFEYSLGLAANFAELIAGIVIIYSVIKVWPVFNTMAKTRVPKRSLNEAFAAIDKGLEVISPGDRITSVREAADRILDSCCVNKASDIHIDLYPSDGEVKGRLRFREGGKLQTVCFYSEKLHRPLMGVFREMCGVESGYIGAASARLQVDALSKGRPIDFRVSFAPANLGEVVTIRVLDPSSAKLGWEELGVPDRDLNRMKHTLDQARGMIVYAGPTGSGKTVSLYTTINSLEKEAWKVMTLEDPLEIELPEVTQLPVLDIPGHRFPELFNVAMNSDPDVLMVGEIRDEITARSCVSAQNSMMLVLTTMSSLSVVDTLERFFRLNQDINPLNLLLWNQRLAKRVCQNCAKPFEPGTEDVEFMTKLCQFNAEDFTQLSAKFVEGVGCEHCEDGYRGRVGAYETLLVSPAMIQALRDGEPTVNLWRLAIEGGTRTCNYDLLSKVANGQSTIDELRRITDSAYYDFG